MRFSSALISFLSSLSATSVAMAMEEPHDSVLHDVTASILEESIEVKYKNKKSHLEPLKIQNSRPNKANDVDLADDKDDNMQKKEIFHHLVDHQQHQDGKSLEECNTSPPPPPPPTTTTTVAAAAAAVTSKDDSSMKRKISLDKESIEKMDYGHLNRGTCSSPNDACVPQHKAIEENGAFFELEDASYASSGYCVPHSVLEDHLVDHQQHQDGKSLEECNTSPPPPPPTTTVTAAAATVTSEDDSLMKRKISLDKESIEKMDYGHLNRGTCSSPNDACVPQHKAIEENGAFFELEDASYASSGYCVPHSVLEGMKYKNGVTTTTMSIIDMEKFNKEEEMTDSYYQDHPQYDHNHRQLDSLDCAFECSGVRPDVSIFLNDVTSFKNLIYRCTEDGECPSDYDGINCCPTDYDGISCWNTTGITDMTAAFLASSFNAPLECWDVGKVTSMYRMFQDTSSFNQHIDLWNVSQVETIDGMFLRATSFNQSIDSWDVSQVTGMQSVFRYTSFNQSIDSWDVSQVTSMQSMFRATNFNQCLSTWAEKTSDKVDTSSMLAATDCPDGIESPDPKVGPWCQNFQQGCVASGFKPLTFKPLQQPSDPPSNKPTDVPTKPPTTSPQDSPTTKSQKKKKDQENKETSQEEIQENVRSSNAYMVNQ